MILIIFVGNIFSIEYVSMKVSYLYQHTYIGRPHFAVVFNILVTMIYTRYINYTICIIFISLKSNFWNMDMLETDYIIRDHLVLCNCFQLCTCHIMLYNYNNLNKIIWNKIYIIKFAYICKLIINIR